MHKFTPSSEIRGLQKVCKLNGLETGLLLSHVKNLAIIGNGELIFAYQGFIYKGRKEGSPPPPKILTALITVFEAL